MFIVRFVSLPDIFRLQRSIKQHSLPLHALLDGRAVGILAQSGPFHLAVGDAGNFPPLAQFVFTLILPTRSQQRAVHKVILELTRGNSFPLACGVLTPVLIRAVSKELQPCIGIVIGFNARQLRTLP